MARHRCHHPALGTAAWDRTMSKCITQTPRASTEAAKMQEEPRSTNSGIERLTCVYPRDARS